MKSNKRKNVKNKRGMTNSAGMSRRDVIKRIGGASIIVSAPHLWIPRITHALDSHNTIKHVIYMRLGGGFRFTAAYNGDVASKYNPFGLAGGIPAGVEWGPSGLLNNENWTTGEGAEYRAELGMGNVVSQSNRIAVMTCVDHEPDAGNADGNHGTGLERYYTGYAGGETGFFTFINYSLRNRPLPPADSGEVVLPAFVFGAAGMALGGGEFAGHRPPVVEGTDFDQFRSSQTENLPAWAVDFAKAEDLRVRDRAHPQHQSFVESYRQTRSSSENFANVFQSPILDLNDESDEVVDGFTQAQLQTVFGDSRGARRMRLALRLLHFGCPAVYFSQGGYDMHSDEQDRLGNAMREPNRLMAGLLAVLPRMPHPAGGTYWDHTLVVFGSEFGRTARGSRFNSAQGSDHGGDRATRWMSMPVMGGVVERSGLGGKRVGAGFTQRDDLRAGGKVYSYRSVMKTVMNMLGGEHEDVFPADTAFDDLVL